MPYAFSRRKPATKPQFRWKRNRHCIQKRRSKQKRDKKKEWRGSWEAECIQSNYCSEAAIQSVAKSLQSWEGNEKEDEEEERERESDRNKRIGAEKPKALRRKPAPKPKFCR
jgi:hypothetical protein